MTVHPSETAAWSSLSPVERVKLRLAEHRCRIVGRMAQCPAHDDRHPSLSLTEGDNGCALLRCHAGCPLESILEALGLGFPDLFAGDTRSPAATLASLPPRLNPDPVPGPGVTSRDDEPELYGLLRDYGAAELQPAPVYLGQLPVKATPAMARVAQHIALCMGLRLAVADDRPLPYSAGFCAAHTGLRDKRHASRVLGQLERHGVIVCVGRMPRLPNGPPDGTKLYAPPLRAGGPVPSEVLGAGTLETLEGPQVRQEVVGLDPSIEVDDELPVKRTELAPVAPRRAVGVVAAGDAANRAVRQRVTKGSGGRGSAAAGSAADAQRATASQRRRFACCCVDGGQLDSRGHCSRCEGFGATEEASP